MLQMTVCVHDFQQFAWFPGVQMYIYIYVCVCVYNCLCVSLCVCVKIVKTISLVKRTRNTPRYMGCLYLYLFVWFIYYIFIYINLFFLALSLLVVDISVFKVVYNAQCVVQRVQFWVDYWCGDIFLSFK